MIKLIHTQIFGVLLAFACGSVQAETLTAVFEVEAGRFDRRNTPISVPLPEKLRNATGFSLENLEDHTFVPVQSVPHHVKGYFGVAWILREPLAAGKSRRYRLSTDLSKVTPRKSSGVRAFVDDQACEHNGCSLDGHRIGTLKVGDRPVLTYHSAIAEPPQGIDPVYRRSGFIHPLQSPSGIVVTDDFPPNHPHQHGVFFAWVSTQFEGRSVDFWNQAKKSGRVSQKTPGEVYHNAIQGGPVFGELKVELLHEDLTAPGGPKPVLRESWLTQVYDIPGPFVIDMESAQHVINEPLTLHKYHYGGFGFRGNRQWNLPETPGKAAADPASYGRSDFLTSEGKNRENGNHTRPRWVDLSGQVDGKFAGVTILDSPTNFRFPQPVRLHPTMPYFCFAPMVEEAFTIKRGHPYVSRYRLLVHDGRPDKEAIERAWNDYAEPPRARQIESTP